MFTLGFPLIDVGFKFNYTIILFLTSMFHGFQKLPFSLHSICPISSKNRFFLQISHPDRRRWKKNQHNILKIDYRISSCFKTEKFSASGFDKDGKCFVGIQTNEPKAAGTGDVENNRIFKLISNILKKQTCEIEILLEYVIWRICCKNNILKKKNKTEQIAHTHTYEDVKEGSIWLPYRVIQKFFKTFINCLLGSLQI